MPGGPLIAAWLLASPGLAQPPVEVAPAEVRPWRRASRVGQLGLGLLVGGAAVDGSVLIVQWTRGSTPLLDGLHTASAATLGTGIGLMGVSGLAAAGTLRKSGRRCPTWSGWTAVGLEAVGLGLVLADPFLLAAGEEPLPAWVDWVKLGALPFAVLQIEAAGRSATSQGWPELPARYPLLGLSFGPGQITLTGQL